MSPYQSFPQKDPDAKLDYLFDWAPKTNNRGLSNWLGAEEIIVSYTITVPEGVDKISDELVNEGTSVIVWLDSGTVGTDYLIECSIVTNQGREDKRTVVLPVRER